MQVLYLTNGDQVEVIKAMKLEQGYSLLLVRDENGERVSLYSADEIDRIETLDEPQPLAS